MSCLAPRVRWVHPLKRRCVCVARVVVFASDLCLLLHLLLLHLLLLLLLLQSQSRRRLQRRRLLLCLPLLLLLLLLLLRLLLHRVHGAHGSERIKVLRHDRPLTPTRHTNEPAAAAR